MTTAAQCPIHPLCTQPCDQCLGTIVIGRATPPADDVGALKRLAYDLIRYKVCAIGTTQDRSGEWVKYDDAKVNIGIAIVAVERERARARADEATRSRDAYKAKTDELAQLWIDTKGRAEQAESKVERLRADAERYRWLRIHHKFCNDSLREIWFDECVSEDGAEFDAAIDAARAVTKI